MPVAAFVCICSRMSRSLANSRRWHIFGCNARIDLTSLYLCRPICFGASCWFAWPNFYAVAQGTLLYILRSTTVPVDCLRAARIKISASVSSYMQRILKNKCTQMHLDINAYHDVPCMCSYSKKCLRIWMPHNVQQRNIPVITSMCFLVPNTPGCKGKNWQSISLQLSSAWAGNASQVLLQLFLQHANTVVLAFGNILVVWRNIWELHRVQRRKAAGKGWDTRHGSTWHNFGGTA